MVRGGTSKEECVVVYIDNNKVVKKERVQGDIVTVVKNYAKKLIDEWNAESSDFIVLRDNYTVTLKKPIRPEIVDTIRKFGVRHMGDKVEVTIPVYELLYSNRWVEESFQADSLILILPYLGDDVTDQITETVLRTLATRQEEEEELEELPEE